MRATSMELKKMNRNIIYRAVLEKENTSIQELSYQLQLSVPTITQNLNELVKQGLLEEKGTFQSTGGRKAKSFSSLLRAKVAFGIDITQNHINYVAIDLADHVLTSGRKRVAFQNSADYFLDLKALINEMRERVGVSTNSILGCGISLPAVVDANARTLSYAPLLKWPENFFEKLQEYIELPFYFINDANAGALAELVVENTGKSSLYLSLSNSVGGAVIMHGEICYGENQRGGEFGHMTLIPGGRECYCGQRGCVDAYCSSLVLSNVTGGSLNLFFQELEKENKKCRDVWEEYSDHLAIIVNNLQVGFDTDIVLGGYVGWHLKPYLQEIRTKVAKRCNFKSNGEQIRVSKLHSEASALGAAVGYISEFISRV